MKYRKRPAVIDAWPWGEYPEDARIVPTPTGGKARWCECGHAFTEHLWCITLKGLHKACPGDWLIKDEKGECYPCKPDIFEATYEAVVGIKVVIDDTEFTEYRLK